jgi:hypothetical protein
MGGLFDWEVVLEAVEQAAPSVVGSQAWVSGSELTATLLTLSQRHFTAAAAKAKAAEQFLDMQVLHLDPSNLFQKVACSASQLASAVMPVSRKTAYSKTTATLSCSRDGNETVRW